MNKVRTCSEFFMVGNVAFSIFFKIMGDIPNASYSLIAATFMMVILQGDN